MAWPEDIEKYKDRYTEGYEAIRNQRFEKQKQLGVIPENTVLSRKEHSKWESLSVEEKAKESRTMAVYAAMIDRLDQNIGRILTKLEQEGKLNNTLILFASDNGGSSEVVNLPGGSGKIGALTNWKSLGKNWANVSNTPFREFKNWSHEGGIKTPLIAYWPEKIKNKGSVTHQAIHFIDFLPTLQEVIGADYPKMLNGDVIFSSPGKSFLPQMVGKPFAVRKEPLFWQWQHGKAIRHGNWKLVAYKGDWELYNLKNDPVEEEDLILQEPDKAEELKKYYAEWAKQYGTD